jgi:uncharacterized protein with PQ loop repeat
MNIADWPIEAIGLSGIYAFTVIMAGVLLLQIHDIFTRRSVKSLSTTWIIYFCAMFISGLFYAVSYDRQPVLINNIMLTSLHLVIAYGIFRFRGFSTNDWLLVAVLTVALVMMALSKRQDVWFFAFAPGGVIALLRQAHHVYRERSTGVLNPWFILAGVLSNGFWSVYAFTIHDWTLSLICPANLIVWAILLALWFKYRRLPAHVLTATRGIVEP